MIEVIGVIEVSPERHAQFVFREKGVSSSGEKRGVRLSPLGPRGRTTSSASPWSSSLPSSSLSSSSSSSFFSASSLFLPPPSCLLLLLLSHFGSMELSVDWASAGLPLGRYGQWVRPANWPREYLGPADAPGQWPNAGLDLGTYRGRPQFPPVPWLGPPGTTRVDARPWWGPLMLELPQTALMPEAWYFPEGGLIPEVWFVPHFAGARGEVDPCAICMVWAIPERRPLPYGFASDKLSKGYSYFLLAMVDCYIFVFLARRHIRGTCGLRTAGGKASCGRRDPRERGDLVQQNSPPPPPS